MAAEDAEGDRKSVASPPDLVTDPIGIARKEASNGLRQFDAVIARIDQVRSKGCGFRLRPSDLLNLNRLALDGISRFAGNYRPSGIYITGSKHQPPPADTVPALVEELCDYVNDNFAAASPIHLAAYVMWRLNWIHPFDDGNGRTARAASYLVLCIKLESRLPGKPTIPDLIADRKSPYYAALEAADKALAKSGKIDLTAMESLLEGLLSAQLVSAVEQARGGPLGPGDGQSS
jgi:fido (protein-threonine AMPylation protein)